MHNIDRHKLRERCDVALDSGFVGSTWRSQQSELIRTIPVLLDYIEGLENTVRKQQPNEARALLDSVQPLPSVEQLIVDLQTLMQDLDRVLSYDTVLRIRDKADALALRLNYAVLDD